MFDAIIAGRGVVVSPSRLKWKIALHILAHASALSRVQPTHKHLPIPPPPYPCLSVCARPLGRGTPVSNPNPLVWFVFQLNLLWCWWSTGSGLFYPPVSQTVLRGKRAVNGQTHFLVGRVVFVVFVPDQPVSTLNFSDILSQRIEKTHCLVLCCIKGEISLCSNHHSCR